MPQFIFTMKDLRKVTPQGKEILKGIWLSFYGDAKIGVLGANGAGKSTLLRIMAGVDKDFAGEAFPAAGTRIGYLPQEPQLDPKKTVLEHVEEAVAEKRKILQRYEEISANYSDDTADEFARLQDQIDAQNLWDLDRQVEVAMDALRLPPGDADVTTLSGGEKRRVALCRLLLQPADMLLLDEPTNHLDAESVAWLERFLKEFPGCVVAITPRPLLPRQRGRLDPGAGPWRRHSLGGQLLVLARAEGPAPHPGGEGGLGPPPHARARAGVDPSRSPGATGEGQGSHHPVRGDAGGGAGGGEARRQARDHDPARAPPRRRGHRREGPAQGLRRQPADGRRQLHAASRRHRRRHRAERGGQDDALPHDPGPGEARRRRAEGRRDGRALLRRPVARQPRRASARPGRRSRTAARTS